MNFKNIEIKIFSILFLIVFFIHANEITYIINYSLPDYTYDNEKNEFETPWLEYKLLYELCDIIYYLKIHPEVKITLSVTGNVWLQLDMILKCINNNQSIHKFETILKTKTVDLTKIQKELLLKQFLYIPFDSMKNNKRFEELSMKYQTKRISVTEYSNQDYDDMKFLYYYSWLPKTFKMYPDTLSNNETLYLFKKHRNYTHSDCLNLLDLKNDMLKSIKPLIASFIKNDQVRLCNNTVTSISSDILLDITGSEKIKDIYLLNKKGYILFDFYSQLEYNNRLLKDIFNVNTDIIFLNIYNDNIISYLAKDNYKYILYSGKYNLDNKKLINLSNLYNRKFDRFTIKKINAATKIFLNIKEKYDNVLLFDYQPVGYRDLNRNNEILRFFLDMSRQSGDVFTYKYKSNFQNDTSFITIEYNKNAVYNYNIFRQKIEKSEFKLLNENNIYKYYKLKANYLYIYTYSDIFVLDQYKYKSVFESLIKYNHNTFQIPYSNQDYKMILEPDNGILTINITDKISQKELFSLNESFECEDKFRDKIDILFSVSDVMTYLNIKYDSELLSNYGLDIYFQDGLKMKYSGLSIPEEYGNQFRYKSLIKITIDEKNNPISCYYTLSDNNKWLFYEKLKVRKIEKGVSIIFPTRYIFDISRKSAVICPLIEYDNDIKNIYKGSVVYINFK